MISAHLPSEKKKTCRLKVVDPAGVLRYTWLHQPKSPYHVHSSPHQLMKAGQTPNLRPLRGFINSIGYFAGKSSPFPTD